MARTFDGVNDKVVFGVSASEWLTTFTASAWVKFPSNFTVERQILTKMDGGYYGKLYLFSEGANQNDFGCYLGRAGFTTTQKSFSTANALTAGVWNFVCATCNTTNAPKLYTSVMGSAAAEVSYAVQDAGAGAYDPDGGAALTVATRGTLDSLWVGEIAETALWNRVLSADEIQSLGRGYAPSFFPDGLVQYLPLTGQTAPEPRTGSGSTTEGTVTEATKSSHPDIMRYPVSRTLYW